MSVGSSLRYPSELYLYVIDKSVKNKYDGGCRLTEQLRSLSISEEECIEGKGNNAKISLEGRREAIS